MYIMVEHALTRFGCAGRGLVLDKLQLTRFVQYESVVQRMVKSILLSTALVVPIVHIGQKMMHK